MFNILDWPVYLQCIVIIIMQLAYTTIRTQNIIHTVRGSILSNMLSSFGITFTWLTSLVLGLKGITDGNLVLSTVYVLGATFGAVPVLVKENRPWLDDKQKELFLNIINRFKKR